MRKKQSIFALNVAKLIAFAYKNGYEITLGEVYRTLDQQLLYFEGYTLKKIGSALKLAKRPRRSKTMFSKHMNKLAIDINIFRDGELLTAKDDFKELATYWKLLNKDNDCGYFWGWDFSHFEMN